jgi:probable addiction module antidote protein
MAVQTKAWDVAAHLDSDEAIVAYIDAAMEDGDPALIAAALGDVARARYVFRGALGRNVA